MLEHLAQFKPRRPLVLTDGRHYWDATVPGGPYYCPACGQRGHEPAFVPFQPKHKSTINGNQEDE